LRRKVIVAALTGVLLTVGRNAMADGQADLEKAHSAYVAHQYDEAESRLRVLLDPKASPLTDPDSINDARMYLGAVLLAEGKKDEAAKTFDQLLQANPDYQPDPLRISLDAIDVFIDARARARERIAKNRSDQVLKAQEERAKNEAGRQKAALRLAMLEKLASTELVIERHSRWVALVPFGAGQFQNGEDTLGWLFLSTQAALAGGALVSGGLSIYYGAQVTDLYQRGNPSYTGYQTAAKQSLLTCYFLDAGLVVAAVAGIVQAQIAFVPERVQTRTRELPALSLSPVISPGLLGLQGRF
jgi:tetratricopeptide (TPR) repeat protein